jgi:DNA topoisomerase-1
MPPRPTVASPTTAVDPEPFSATLGLSYVTEDVAGIRRVRRGRGWSFHGPDGRLVDPAERDRCIALAVPPAWQEVWICPNPLGHLQASGVDEARRRQYRYHDLWTEGRRLANFDRLADIGARLDRLRRDLDRLLADDADPVRRATAAMVRLVDAGMARIGGARSARELGHHGVSTLQSDHVAIDGDHITLAYLGKSGVERRVEVEDPLVADVLAELEAGGDRLFDIRDGAATYALTAADANELLAELTGGTMTCKDFRTWGGSSVALAARIAGADEVAAVDAAAERLGNTRAVARSSYVHPDVLTLPVEELRDVWRRSRSSIRFDRRERALARLLADRPSLLGRWLEERTG